MPREGATGEIEVQLVPARVLAQAHRWLRLAVVRGVVALAESLKIGFSALDISANAQLPTRTRRSRQAARGRGTVVVALALRDRPVLRRCRSGSRACSRTQLGNSRRCSCSSRRRSGSRSSSATCAASRACATCAGCSSTTAPSTRRSPATRPAMPLTPENAQRYSRLHPRCGTSFLLIVMIVAIFVFAPLGTPAWYWLFPSRDPRDPARRRHRLRDHQVGRAQPRTSAGRARSCGPGLQLQKLTTREPDLAELAVAIAALEAVLAVENPGAAPTPGPGRRSKSPPSHGWPSVHPCVQCERGGAGVACNAPRPGSCSAGRHLLVPGVLVRPCAATFVRWRQADGDFDRIRSAPTTARARRRRRFPPPRRPGFSFDGNATTCPSPGDASPTPRARVTTRRLGQDLDSTGPGAARVLRLRPRTARSSTAIGLRDRDSRRPRVAATSGTRTREARAPTSRSPAALRSPTAPFTTLPSSATSRRGSSLCTSDGVVAAEQHLGPAADGPAPKRRRPARSDHLRRAAARAARRTPIEELTGRRGRRAPVERRRISHQGADWAPGARFWARRSTSRPASGKVFVSVPAGSAFAQPGGARDQGPAVRAPDRGAPAAGRLDPGHPQGLGDA